MQALYLLLITNKGSNILEDLETLRLLAKIVPEYVHPMDEEGILNSAFDLIFAFDEVIAMGYRESITVTQVPLCSPSFATHSSHPCTCIANTDKINVACISLRGGNRAHAVRAFSPCLAGDCVW